jgi:hypothetical protein
LLDDPIALISEYCPACMAGNTFSQPILAVLMTPHLSFFMIVELFAQIV